MNHSLSPPTSLFPLSVFFSTPENESWPLSHSKDFAHLSDVNAWSTLRLLDKAGSIIEAVIALANGDTRTRLFLNVMFVSHKVIGTSQAVEEALERILLAADINQHRHHNRDQYLNAWASQSYGVLQEGRLVSLYATRGVSLPTPAGIAHLVITAPSADQHHVLCVAKAHLNAFHHRR